MRYIKIFHRPIIDNCYYRSMKSFLCGGAIYEIVMNKIHSEKGTELYLCRWFRYCVKTFCDPRSHFSRNDSRFSFVVTTYDYKLEIYQIHRWWRHPLSNWQTCICAVEETWIELILNQSEDSFPILLTAYKSYILFS